MFRGVLIFVLLAANLVFWGVPVFLIGLLKLVTYGETKGRVIRFVTRFGENFVAINNKIFDAFLTTKWEIDGVDDVRLDGHYLIISNHISWVDIFAVLRAFQGRAPFIRFFLKQELIWMPVVGAACWALEFPFMKRHSPEFLERHPEKRGEDLETTRRACRRYRKLPVSILNFVEGTRFSRDKQADQDSPYKHLLRPRIGGISFVLASLGEQLDAMFDITLAYPGHDITMWDFVTNRVPRIVVHARRIELTPDLIDPAVTEPGPARDRLKAWFDALWREKDAYLEMQVAGGRSQVAGKSPGES
jgi:1-acyl-sn-glycerol-3-phosphate acyltransferase